MDTGIYKIENIVNDKIYVGSGNIKERFYRHRYELRHNKHNNDHLQNAWNKYGENNFEFCVITKIQEDYLTKAEQYWMDKFKSYEREKGYNIIPRADRKEFSKEHKKRLSESHKGRDVTVSTRRKLSNSNIGENHYNFKRSSEDWKKERNERKSTNISYNKEENHSQTNLTKNDVKFIIKNKNNFAQKELAEKYGVARSTISAIQTGRNWQGVEV